MAELSHTQFERLLAIIKEQDVYRLHLGGGIYTAIDEQDKPLTEGYVWRARKGYAYGLKDGKGVFLHRLILGLCGTKQPLVDHIDGDPLNNQRFNLRTCTHAQNSRNRKSSTGTSRFKGVHSSFGAWRASIGYEGKKIRLGTFTSEVKAAQAYDKAAKELHGEFARTNADLDYY